jgi:hypothetical protein
MKAEYVWNTGTLLILYAAHKPFITLLEHGGNVRIHDIQRSLCNGQVMGRISDESLWFLDSGKVQYLSLFKSV